MKHKLHTFKCSVTIFSFMSKNTIAFYSAEVHNSRHYMTKKWNNYTRREKTIGILGAFFGVFVIGSIANGISAPSSSQPSSSSTQSQSAITEKEVIETVAIPYEKTTIESSLYDKGTAQVTTAGSNGEKKVTYKVTLTNGIESSRDSIKEDIIKAPVSEVTSIGTYVKPAAPERQASDCDANYSGACVPIASDVDCAGGKGNGPAYVRGPVYVVGTDIYDLDGDGDGVGCE